MFTGIVENMGKKQKNTIKYTNLPLTDRVGALALAPDGSGLVNDTSSMLSFIKKKKK